MLEADSFYRIDSVGLSDSPIFTVADWALDVVDAEDEDVVADFLRFSLARSLCVGSLILAVVGLNV